MLDELSPSSARVRARIRELLDLAREEIDLESFTPSVETLLRHTRRQLLECARYMGLTGIDRLAKDALAKRCREALEELAARETEAEEPFDRPHKFDLGYATPLPAEVTDIPWGYGQDRVTAMVVDPERLYVYWEITDDAIDRARRGLGPGGPDAVLTLRVYEVTGRIFDGTNARGYFDHTVSRTDRQWFFFIGKPTSTAVVELGLKSGEGYFVRVARSGRADFPRREPVQPGGVEWLTVRTATGEVGESTASTHAPPPPPAEGGLPTPVEPIRVWDIRRTHGGVHGEWIVRDESFGEWVSTYEWWEGPVMRTSWEAGPFTFAVEAPPRVEERYLGKAIVTTINDATHVVYGPWQVVIRGIGGRAERKVLGVWEIHRSWVTEAGTAAQVATYALRGPGGSEQLAQGASERRWLAGSEVRLGGASEIYRLGASELRYLGASETLFAAASEWRLLGASEWRYAGASEQRYAGASEQRYAGASEQRYAGASEQLRYPEVRDALPTANRRTT